jgi:hypothetical protein
MSLEVDFDASTIAKQGNVIQKEIGAKKKVSS